MWYALARERCSAKQTARFGCDVERKVVMPTEPDDGTA